MSDVIELAASDGSTARIALHGAEPVSWRAGGREYLWSGDPAHWNRHAPWLFPVVGASAEGRIRAGGRDYPMAQHGFARDLPFAVAARSADAATLRLTDSDETHAHYPFAFRLDITARIRPAGLDFAVEVENPGPDALPYAVGFHPAFPWPFAGGARAAGGGYAVAFEAAEAPRVPEVGAGGLLLREERGVPLDGRVLPLDPALFTEALVFRNARSRHLRFTGPGGAAIRMAVEDFPHLAVWTKPTAPFLSLECWTGHADWAGFTGEIAERDSQRLLAPGERARHAVRLDLEGLG
ncbi:aldose 1-epimerase family protein [Methylobacterium oxalidis]|uniref:Aldose 1-epimerase n=1 Tax=Methylobacterium oxalidis TaxID=944322 RepID=A0A512J508_9HYPH|nr:aldose 1-epimerase family protein [Methylobacterium oxalidis]GEP05003.1 aldose 1-epimerase [Methylobacterium oxalidis]GJE34788.1 Protein LacX, plasmid [Methylobacterium oxalidis]GLS63741.1 aldose 1-epimerase [Methylobacterium oxalidis]